MSYGKAPLGNEFFVEAADLLFQYGVQDTPIKVKEMGGAAVLLLNGEEIKLIFDFAR